MPKFLTALVLCMLTISPCNAKAPQSESLKQIRSQFKTALNERHAHIERAYAVIDSLKHATTDYDKDIIYEDIAVR